MEVLAYVFYELFEWFIAKIWRQHGPLAGIVSIIVILAMLIGCIFGAISLWNFAVS